VARPGVISSGFCKNGITLVTGDHINHNTHFGLYLVNGGGALVDFGCYLVNWSLWLKGMPQSVYAVANHLKPELFPEVEDNATIVLNFKDGVAILEATWDLPPAQRPVNGLFDVRMGHRQSVAMGEGHWQSLAHYGRHHRPVGQQKQGAAGRVEYLGPSRWS
jgi:predicted dehydrogenase